MYLNDNLTKDVSARIPNMSVLRWKYLTRDLDFALEALPETDYAADAFTKIPVAYRAAVKPDSHPEIKCAEINDGRLLSVAADDKIYALIVLQTWGTQRQLIHDRKTWSVQRKT